MTKQCIIITSGKRRQIYDILKMSHVHHYEDVQFTTFSRRLIHDVLEKSDFNTWRRQIYNILKTSDLWRNEDVCKTKYVSQRDSNVYIKSKETIFSYLVLPEIFRKF